MASLEEASAGAADDAPLEFSSPEEENAYYSKIEKARSKDTQVRRMTMMGGLGVQGPQEHLALFKLNPAIEDASAQIAKRAGSLLSTIQEGVMGASFRPVISGDGFDWVFKVWFKSVEDAESYYGLVDDVIQGANADGLVAESLMLDMAGLRGSVKAGSGEFLALLQKPDGGNLDPITESLEDSPPTGMTKHSLRNIHSNEALFSGYLSLQPGYTDALLVNFDTAENLSAFVASGSLQASISKTIPEGGELSPVLVSYVF